MVEVISKKSIFSKTDDPETVVYVSYMVKILHFMEFSIVSFWGGIFISLILVLNTG